MKSHLQTRSHTSNPNSSDHLAEDYLEGLQGNPKTLPCKYLYDECGSRFFDQICELEEYYPTRTEEKILQDNISEIVSLCGPNCLLTEFGSGNSSKTRWLLENLHRPVGYVPIDISGPHLMSAVARLERDYPSLEILPVCADYTSELELPSPSRPAEQTVIFFPGSTIGNFTPNAAREFLQRIGAECQPGDGFLVGVDLVKDRKVLERAYNDSKGITAAFNLNLLRRANREAGADFCLKQFVHRAHFNAAESRIEMHLVSTCRQTVHLLGNAIEFSSNEPIITEFSYKYRLETFRALAAASGWRPLKTWVDPLNYFSVHYLSRRTG